MDNIKRAGLYIRVSHEEQVKDGFSLDAQKDNLIKYAKENNYKIVDIYADEGISARKSYTKRKEFMRLIEDVKTNKIDIILFIKLDRWFRNVADYHKIQEILEKYNVGWKATTENYDTTTANGRLYLNIRLAVAQDEADRTSERIKFVFEKKIQDGEYISGNSAPGYKVENKRLVIDEEEAKVVRFVFETYLKLKSKRATIFATSNEFQRNFTQRVIYRMLKNEKYIGKYRNNSNYCEPIVSKELFDNVQKTLKERRMRYSYSNEKNCDYIFSGIVRCSICGACLSGNKSSKVNKKGEKKYSKYYRCPHYLHEKSCKNSRVVSEKKLEFFLVENILQKLKDYKVEYQLKQKSKKNPNLDNKKNIENKIKRLQTLYVNELIELEEYKKQYSKLKGNLAKFDIVEEKEKDFTEIDNILNSDFESIYNQLTPLNKRIFWQNIIEKITPTEDRNIFNIFLK